MSEGARLRVSAFLNLRQRDWQQQKTRLQARIAVDELIKGWDIEDLSQKVPAVDEHGQAGTINQFFFKRYVLRSRQLAFCLSRVLASQRSLVAPVLRDIRGVTGHFHC